MEKENFQSYSSKFRRKKQDKQRKLLYFIIYFHLCGLKHKQLKWKQNN